MHGILCLFFGSPFNSTKIFFLVEASFWARATSHTRSSTVWAFFLKPQESVAPFASKYVLDFFSIFINVRSFS